MFWLLACVPDYDVVGEVGGPPVVLIQGGKVARERYHWLADELGAWGYTVLVPQYPRDLAILGMERTHRALEDARAQDLVAPGPAVLVGHSLGGAVGAYQWVEHPEDYAELVLLASWPAEKLEVESRDERSLLIVGTQDGEPLELFQENTARFTNLTTHVVEGMTHYDWCDDVTDKELEKQGTVATRPTDETRAEAMDALAAFLDGQVATRTAGTRAARRASAAPGRAR